MKKKLLFISVLSVICFAPFAFAENIHTNISIPDVEGLNDIGLRFCDDGYDKLKEVDEIFVRPGQKKEVCLVFFNKATTGEITINAGLVNATVNGKGEMLCEGEMGTGYVPSLFSYDTDELNFVLQPGEQLIKKIKLNTSKDLSGSFYGCVAYQPEQNKPEDFSGTFFVIRRKVGPMKINITGDVYNFGRRDDIKYTYKSHQITILKTIAVILGILLVYYIVQTMRSSKKPENNKKK